MSVYFEDIEEIAARNLFQAQAAAGTIKFALESLEMAHNYSKSTSLSARATLIGNDPDYSWLENACGVAAWSVLLNVDLRNSTWLAEEHGAKDMYLIMHTYMPTMVELVEQYEGKVVGLRGDGLIAAFGITKNEDDNQSVSTETSNNALRSATNCGKAMVEATKYILNPLFGRNDLYDDLAIGVAIDVGDIVITRIGWRDANEVTTYGKPVNRVCKLNKGHNEVVISNQAYQLYPSSKGGQMQFRARSGGGYYVQYPDGTWKLVKENRPVRIQGAKSVTLR